jgi:hypothetical protein
MIRVSSKTPLLLMTLRTSTDIVEYVTTMTKDGSTSTMTSIYSWNTCQRKASSQFGIHQKKKPSILFPTSNWT